MEKPGWTGKRKRYKGKNATIPDVKVWPQNQGWCWPGIAWTGLLGNAASDIHAPRSARECGSTRRSMWLERTLSQVVGLSEEMGCKQALHLHPCATISSLFPPNLHRLPRLCKVSKFLWPDDKGQGGKRDGSEAKKSIAVKKTNKRRCIPWITLTQRNLYLSLQATATV